MKTQTFIFTICAAFVLAFFGCTKKQAFVETKTDALSKNATQSEPAAIVQETQLAETGFVLDGELLQENRKETEKDGVWSEENAKAINKMKKHLRETSKNDLTICTPEGTYLLYYSNNEKTVRPPVTSITDVDLKMNGEAAYVRFSSCLNSKASNKITCHSTDYATAIALEEEGKDDNILTLLFSNDQAKTWNTAYVEIVGEYLGGEKYPKYYPFCTDSNTGYLLLGGMEKVIVDVGYSGEKIPGARIFRTQDAGASWEEIGRISDTVNHYLFVQGSTVFLGGRKNRYPCLFKSDDCISWEEINFPVDSEKYLSGRSDGFVFKGEYGIVDTYMNLHEGGYEIISFATKGGGESWIVCNN